ncbi:hypothetical protein, partial [Enterobacter intestinihominis]
VEHGPLNHHKNPFVLLTTLVPNIPHQPLGKILVHIRTVFVKCVAVKPGQKFQQKKKKTWVSCLL